MMPTKHDINKHHLCRLSVERLIEEFYREMEKRNG